MLHSDNADMAPPLPPRKGTQVKVDGNGTPQRTPVSRSSTKAVPAVDSSQALPQSRSTEEVTVIPSCTEFEVPRTVAPPVPKHQTPLTSLVYEMKRANIVTPPPSDSPDDGVIVGPAETISGLIDTRPLEARKPIIIKNPMPSPTEQQESHKEGVIIERCATNGGNNLYQLKTTNFSSSSASSPLSHARHQSLSTPFTGVSVPKSVTTPQFSQERVVPDGAEGVLEAGEMAGKQPLLYENVSINNKDCNVPYENINLEYISRLVSEGYSKENAITALGISRNNIEMACDILHEFVSKSGA